MRVGILNNDIPFPIRMHGFVVPFSTQWCNIIQAAVLALVWIFGEQMVVYVYGARILGEN